MQARRKPAPQLCEHLYRHMSMISEKSQPETQPTAAHGRHTPQHHHRGIKQEDLSRL